MTSPTNGRHSFRITMAAGVAESIKKLHARAIAIGIGKAVLAAIKSMRQRLEADPTNYGEPLFHLPAIQMQVRMAIEIPLLIHFALHEEQRLVFIQRVRGMSGHRLEEEE